MKRIRVIELGNIVHTGNWSSPQRGRIYSIYGIAPACNCCGGGGLETKILEIRYENGQDDMP
jgi:hypothetical protein